MHKYLKSIIKAYTKLIYHIVLRTYQSKPTISEDHERDLYAYIYYFCRNHDCKVYRINGMPDHVHICISIHPTIAVASFVHDLKIATNNFMSSDRSRFPMFERWEQGYCALTYSESEKDTVVQYIINQKNHHARRSTRHELILLLSENGIDCSHLID